ncbi:MAG TPA: hypothetical protein VKT33_13870 [Candidatus Angelobacter sp.]|nr:hypothetical protein [Candidatus Angelobacter sp.]
MRKLSFFLPILLVFSATLGAQTVDEVISKSIVARGGASKIMAIQSRRLTGEIELSSPDTGTLSASFVEFEARPGKLRRDLTIEAIHVTMAQGYDGQNGWKTTPSPGKSVAEPMTGDELKEFQEESDMDGALVSYRQKGHTAELVGKEKVDGAEAYNIKLILKTGEQRNIYIDTTSFLELKVVSQVVRDGVPVEIQTLLSNYREVEGVKYPFAIESKIPSQQVDSKVTIEKIESNVPIDGSVFKAPAPDTKPAPAAAPK